MLFLASDSACRFGCCIVGDFTYQWTGVPGGVLCICWLSLLAVSLPFGVFFFWLVPVLCGCDIFGFVCELGSGMLIRVSDVIVVRCYVVWFAVECLHNVQCTALFVERDLFVAYII